MTMQSAWLISSRSIHAERLGAVLATAGTTVNHLIPDAVFRHEQPLSRAPDLLLISATLDVPTVRRLVVKAAGLSGRRPAVVVFVDGLYTDLERHVLAGSDYIVPPYVVGQVRDRLVTASLRQAPGAPPGGPDAAEVLRHEGERESGV